MTVTIDPNIKKQRIFINKNGEQITEEQMFGKPVGAVMDGHRGTEDSKQGEGASKDTN